MVRVILCDLWSCVIKGIAISNLFSGILILSPCVKSDYLEAAMLWVHLRPVETTCVGAETNNESEWALSWSQLCRVSPHLQIFPAEVQTWRSRVKLFILCPVWILYRRIFELNKMAVLKCTVKFGGNLLHSNSNQNWKLEPNLSQTSDKELVSLFFFFNGPGAKCNHSPQVDIMLFPGVSSVQGTWKRNSASYYRDAQGGPRNC